MSLKKLVLFGVLLSIGAAFSASVKPNYSLLIKHGQVTSDVVIAVPGGSLFMGDAQLLHLYAIPAVSFWIALCENALVAHNPALKKLAGEVRKLFEASPVDMQLHLVMSVVGLAVLTTAGYDCFAKKGALFEGMKAMSYGLTPLGKTVGFDATIFQLVFKKLYDRNVRDFCIELHEKVANPSFDEIIDLVDAHYPAGSEAVREYKMASQACGDFVLKVASNQALMKDEATRGEFMLLSQQTNDAMNHLVTAFGCEKLVAKPDGTPRASSFNFNMDLTGIPFQMHEFIGSYFGFSKRWDFAPLMQPKAIAWVSQENVESPVAWYDIEKNIVYTDLPVVVGEAVGDGVFVTGSMQRDEEGSLIALQFDENVVIASLQDGAQFIQDVIAGSLPVVSCQQVAVGRMKVYDNDLAVNANIIQVPACAQRFVVCCKQCGADVALVVPEEPVEAALVSEVMVTEENAVSSTGATESAPSEDVSA